MLLCDAERCGRAFLHGRSDWLGASVVMMMMLMAGADAGNHGDDRSAGQKNSQRVAVRPGFRLTGIAGIGKKPKEAQTGEEEQKHRPEAEGSQPWRSRTALRTRR